MTTYDTPPASARPAITLRHRKRRTAIIITAALILAAAIAVLSVSLTGHHAAPRHHHQVMPLTTLAACRYLRADIVTNGGTPDRAALNYLHRHAYERDVVVLSGDAAKKVGSDTNVPFLMLEGICSRHGVQIGASG